MSQVAAPPPVQQPVPQERTQSSDRAPQAKAPSAKTQQQTEAEKVKVPGYTRGKNNKVSEHERRKPVREREEEAPQQEVEDDDDDGLYDFDDDHDSGDADDGEGRERKVKQKLSMEAFIRMNPYMQQQAVVEEKLSRIQGKIARDEARTTILKDASDEMGGHITDILLNGNPFITQRANLPPGARPMSEQGDPGVVHDGEQIPAGGSAPPGSLGDFVNLLNEGIARGHGNDNLPEIIRRLESGGYNDGTHFGKRSLVPHLRMAGMSWAAELIQKGEFKF